MKGKLIAAVLLVMLVLAGCKAGETYPFTQAEEDIAAIELIYVERYEQPSDYSVLDAVATVEQSQWQESLSRFRQIRCESYFNDPPQGDTGMLIRITYADGGYEVIGNRCGLYVNPKGQRTYKYYHFEEKAFAALVEAQA